MMTFYHLNDLMLSTIFFKHPKKNNREVVGVVVVVVECQICSLVEQNGIISL